MVNPATPPVVPLSGERVPGRVSVIIGAYNSGKDIGQTLDSLLAQTHPDVEIIVVDDGSTDHTWDVLSSYGDRIVAVKQRNGGVAAARNTGLQRARGEFVALMDHDDLCMPERLAVQVAVLRQWPEVGLCCTEFGAFNQQGRLAERYSAHYYAQCDEAHGGAAGHYARHATLDVGALHTAVFMGEVYEDIACGNFVHPPTVMFRANLVERIGGFDPAARLSCDWDWLVRAARVTTFAHVDQPLLDYRRSSTQISSERFSPRISLDVLHVTEGIVARDPELWRRKRATFQHLLGGMHVDAAYANAEAQPRLALALLAKAWWRYHAFTGMSLRVLVRALVPRTVLDVARRRHRQPA
jgi:glycosyltransferase involved in cell wall biosynthesis